MRTGVFLLPDGYKVSVLEKEELCGLTVVRAAHSVLSATELNFGKVRWAGHAFSLWVRPWVQFLTMKNPKC